MELLLIAVLITLLILWAILWVTHIRMVRGTPYPCGFATFPIFLKHFQRYEWKIDIGWPGSFFGKNYSEQYIHAGIIRIDSKGMILDPISFLIFTAWSYNEYNKRVPQPYRIKRTWIKWE